MAGARPEEIQAVESIANVWGALGVLGLSSA